MEVDSCLQGGGGFDEKRCYGFTYTERISQAYHISQLESLNAMFAIRALAKFYPKDAHVELHCDNIATVYTLSQFKARDKIMLAAARAIWFFCHERQINLSVTHKAGELLVFADALSREVLGGPHVKVVRDQISKLGVKRIYPDFKLFDFANFL